MSDPLSDKCVYCGSRSVLDDAWFCHRTECWTKWQEEEMAACLKRTASCSHDFQSNPGMFDTTLRYCTKCGVFEHSRLAGGAP